MTATKKAAAIWKAVAGHAYVWHIKPSARQRLDEIVPDAAAALPPEPATANVHIRVLLGPILRDGDEARRFGACRWIVTEWGGIRGNRQDRLEAYARGLADGSLAAADAFAAGMGVDGISSWSKLLAFAHPTHHAVYDARTAVALNILLGESGVEGRFWMPDTQNRDVRPARRALRAGRRGGRWLGYREYLDVLRGMVHAGAPSMLAAEMALFAAAPGLAARCCRTSLP